MTSQNRSSGNRAHGRRVSGFTLIELMITVAIIAVLASIAYASYENTVVNSRRKAAATCLMEAAQFMERFYTTRLTYVNPPAPLPIACINDVAAFYVVAVAGVPTASAYNLTAVPQGQQATKDTTCGTLGLNQAGTRTETGTGSPANCW